MRAAESAFQQLAAAACAAAPDTVPTAELLAQLQAALDSRQERQRSWALEVLFALKEPVVQQVSAVASTGLIRVKGPAQLLPAGHMDRMAQ